MTRFTEKCFFSTILGFTQSHSGLWNDPPQRFVQKIPGTYKGSNPNNITGINKIHLKCDCINGSTVNGVREPILYGFALEKPTGL